MEFTTFDADNDNWQRRNCADNHEGGFWWNDCGRQSINGRYSKFNSVVISWYKPYSLKKTQLMIRPAAYN